MSASEKQSCLQSLRRVLCCRSDSPPDPPKVDAASMHSIVIPTATPQPDLGKTAPNGLAKTTEIRWSSERETLRMTIKSDPGGPLVAEGEGGERAQQSKRRDMGFDEGRDTMRNPLQSFVDDTDMVRMEPSFSPSLPQREESLHIGRGLKYRDLPHVFPTSPPRSPRLANPFPSGFPLKPITPSSYLGKTRIPTARPKPVPTPESLPDPRSSSPL